MQKRSRRIGATPTKQCDVKNRLCLEDYCSVQPRPLAVDLDSGPVNCDPRRLRLRRVVSDISEPVDQISNRSM